MNEILHQLGPLLIGSIPTMLIFLFLVISYRLLLHRPLLNVLAERRSRTEGAIERAHAAIAAADAKAQEYEARLRAARAEILHAREARMKTWTEERDRALASARQAAHERLVAARKDLNAQAEFSRQEIERNSESLVADVLKAVLPGGMASGGAVAEVPR